MMDLESVFNELKAMSQEQFDALMEKVRAMSEPPYDETVNEEPVVAPMNQTDISNNNAPQILQNFTRYPTVQPSPFNYKTGTLSSLIGTISNGVYSDTVSERNEIMDLSITQNTLFLKSRKGDLMKIRISGAIESGTMDNSAAQAQTVKIPWVEIGDASEARIIITESDGAWPN